MLFPEGWSEPQKILIILAHPDDPEFFCGGAINRWVLDGNEVVYCLFTRGDKGSSNPKTDIKQLMLLRVIEQNNAAKVLGVSEVIFLDYLDGELIPTLDTRKSAVKVIRKVRPDIIITGDPNNLFPRPGRINHPDHRAMGQIVIDAIFPSVGNPHYFPELISEGLLPHKVKELWLSNPIIPDIYLDVTQNWDLKIKAILEHNSQIDNKEEVINRMKSRFSPESTFENPQFIEYFKRIIIE
jgi:LmbE family N-acetylglucosaminyl deacetylase